MWKSPFFHPLCLFLEKKKVHLCLSSLTHRGTCRLICRTNTEQRVLPPLRRRSIVSGLSQWSALIHLPSAGSCGFAQSSGIYEEQMCAWPASIFVFSVIMKMHDVHLNSTHTCSSAPVCIHRSHLLQELCKNTSTQRGGTSNTLDSLFCAIIV